MFTRCIPCAAVVAAVVLITGLAGGPSQASASDQSGMSGISGVAPGALVLLGCACLVAAPRKGEAQDDAAPAGVPSNA